MASGRSWPPRFVTLNPTKATRSRGGEVSTFVNAYARVTKESVGGHAGERLVLRPWQEKLLNGLFAEDRDGRLRHRTGLIGMARKNGKSALGAGLALWSLYCGEAGGEVYSCAATREQARIVFGTAKRMVELDPELSSISKLYRDAIEFPDTGSVYRVLSREAGASEGLSPTLTIFDEVHVQPDDELWNVMQLGSAARREPMLLGITTAGSRTDNLGRDSLCFRLYQHGRKVAAKEVDDPSFFFAWWEPKAGAEADHTKPEVWREANPGFGDLCAAEDFESTLVRTPEPEFRTKRTNVWVTGITSALPFGAWAKCADDSTPNPDVPVVLVADGSWNGDSTGIVAVTVEERPHISVVGLWERTDNSGEWRVPITEVESVIVETCRTRPVVEIAMDPFRWQRSLQALADEGLPVTEYPMASVERMVKAWKLFYDGVLDRKLSHGDDSRLNRHVDNMVLKLDSRGARPTKDAKNSSRHIDLGVCAVAGIDRALWQLNREVVDVSTQIF